MITTAPSANRALTVAPAPARCRAILRERYCGTAGLRLGDVPVPDPGPGEVLVRIEAAGVDRGVWHLMEGRPLLIRPAFGLRRPRRATIGLDAAGLVAAIGADVTEFAVGDRVFGICAGSFAEYALGPVAKLARMPAELGYAEAATLPVSGLTALQAVRDAGRIVPGQRVLITGAGGGVGALAVQIARAAGAEVTAVCSTGKIDLVRGLGAAAVIDHTRAEIDAIDGRYDVILDIAGSRPLRRLRSVLTPAGTLVVVGGEGPGRWFGGFDRSLRAAALSPFVRQRLVMLVSRETAADIAILGEMVTDGTLIPTLDRIYPLAEAGAAIDAVVAGRVRGKLALGVGP